MLQASPARVREVEKESSKDLTVIEFQAINKTKGTLVHERG